MSTWKQKRDRLAVLIKKCSDKHGGDDQVFLRDYGLELISKYTDNLDEPIACFEYELAR